MGKTSKNNDNSDTKSSTKARKNRSASENSSGSESNVKCVLVGDGSCGKSSLVHSYISNQIPEGYTPTVFDDYSAEVTLGKKKLQVKIRDTAGQEDYDRLRPLSYDDVNLAVVCYDVTSHDSFVNVEVRWWPELQHFCPEMPKILVACKCDLSPSVHQTNGDVTATAGGDGDQPDNQDDDVITEQQDNNKEGEVASETSLAPSDGKEDLAQVTSAMGREMTAKIGADIFIECSAKTGHNIDELFNQIAQVAYIQSSKEKSFYDRFNLKKKGKCAIL